MTGVIKKGEFGHRRIHKEKAHINMNTEISRMHLQSKEVQGLLETPEAQKKEQGRALLTP